MDRKPRPAKAGSASEDGGFWRWCRRMLEEKPKETVGTLLACLPALGAGLYALGVYTHRAREAFLGVGTADFKYPKEDLLLTGLGALTSIPWRGLGALFSSHGTLRASTWALLALAAACWLAGRARRRLKTLGVLAILLPAAGLLAFGTSFFTIAVHATTAKAAGRQAQALCTNELSPNLADRAAYESCSWLANDSTTNSERRQSLSGLLFWLLLAGLVAAWVGARLDPAAGWRGKLRWGVVGLHLLLCLLLLRQLPIAHAYASWGLRYPALTSTGDCDEELLRAVEAGTCCAFDISAGAETRMLLLRGRGCPGGPGALPWREREDERTDCLKVSETRVVFHGCG